MVSVNIQPWKFRMDELRFSTDKMVNERRTKRNEISKRLDEMRDRADRIEVMQVERLKAKGIDIDLNVIKMNSKVQPDHSDSSDSDSDETESSSSSEEEENNESYDVRNKKVSFGDAVSTIPDGDGKDEAPHEECIKDTRRGSVHKKGTKRSKFSSSKSSKKDESKIKEFKRSTNGTRRKSVPVNIKAAAPKKYTKAEDSSASKVEEKRKILSLDNKKESSLTSDGDLSTCSSHKTSKQKALDVIPRRHSEPLASQKGFNNTRRKSSLPDANSSKASTAKTKMHKSGTKPKTSNESNKNKRRSVPDLDKHSVSSADANPECSETGNVPTGDEEEKVEFSTLNANIQKISLQLAGVGALKNSPWEEDTLKDEDMSIADLHTYHKPMFYS